MNLVGLQSCSKEAVRRNLDRMVKLVEEAFENGQNVLCEAELPFSKDEETGHEILDGSAELKIHIGPLPAGKLIEKFNVRFGNLLQSQQENKKDDLVVSLT